MHKQGGEPCLVFRDGLSAVCLAGRLLGRTGVRFLLAEESEMRMLSISEAMAPAGAGYQVKDTIDAVSTTEVAREAGQQFMV